ncbi:hypothetical protein [Aquamicrobium sp. LC103]|nr:hypothetical protein [Aquamicrobium sp. LC103]
MDESRFQEVAEHHIDCSAFGNSRHRICGAMAKMGSDDGHF